MRTIALAALAFATPLSAQVPAPPAIAASAAPVDPARLAAAERVAAKVLPAGTYEKLMGSTFDQAIESMLSQMMGVTVDELAQSAGINSPPEGRDVTLAQLMMKADPHWTERQQITARVMVSEMKPIMIKLEPEMRAAVASAYARRFTLDQLREVERFFSSPAGQAFAGQWMTIWSEPEVMKGSMAMVPELMKRMPAIMKKTEAATAHLPPPPKPTGHDEPEDEEHTPVS